MLHPMVRRVVWLGLVCACTQDFSVFDPDGSAPPNDGSTEIAPGDAAADVSTDAGVPDAANDVAPGDAAVSCTETGALTYNGHCYFLVATTATQSASATGCTNAGAHLVTITNANEQAAVIALGPSTERWTDLYRNGGAVKDQTYAWLTGEGRNGFNAWSPGEPNGSGQCVRLLATGLWADDDCANAHASICERE